MPRRHQHRQEWDGDGVGCLRCSITVTYHDTQTDDCGGTTVITRTWTALDQCGNATNVVQRLTVRDTTPPSLTVPASVVLECPADTSTNANGVALATDTCGSVVITFTDQESDGCGGTKVVSRWWTAVDECGNATNALQTLTVQDTKPPTLTAPPNLVLECPADLGH